MNTQKTGMFIAQCRKNKKMTQKQLADYLGISDKSVSKWERGINLPESSLFIPLCKCLDIEVQELLLGERIDKEALLSKSNQLIVDLSQQEDKNAYLFYQMIIFFLLLPIMITIFFSIWTQLFEMIDIISCFCPFTFMYSFIKIIECVKYNKNYFLYFVISSTSLFIIILHFIFLLQR